MDIFSYFFSTSRSLVDSRFSYNFHVHILIFMFIYAFTHIFVNCKVSSGMLKISDKKPILSQAKQIAAHVLKDL